MKTLPLFKIVSLFALNISMAHAAIFDGPPTANSGGAIYDGPPPPASVSTPASPARGEDLWMVVAAGRTPLLFETPTTVNLQGVRMADINAARAKALEKCRDPHFPLLDCHVIFESRSGCMYFSRGVSPAGDAGWGMGQSPQEAHDQCHKVNYGLDCSTNAYGACANTAAHVISQPATAAPPVRYLRVFVKGEYLLNGQRTSVVAQAVGATPALAIQRAKANCRWRKPEVGDCEVIATVTRGCLYSAMGAGPGGVGYQLGESEQEAINNCQAGGLQNCAAKVIGGCVNWN